MENKKFSFYTNISIEEALTNLQSSISGLSESAVAQRLIEFGPNEIKEVDVTWWQILKAQILSPFMLVFFGDWSCLFIKRANLQNVQLLQSLF